VKHSERGQKKAYIVIKPSSQSKLAVDWLDGLIGPGGLQLVVSLLLQTQFQSYGQVWEKVNK
jgi:hypothetical protein